MDTQQPAEGSEPVWGAAPPQPSPEQPSTEQPRRWSAGKTAAVVAVAAVVAAGGGYGISQLVGTASASTQGGGGFGAGGGGGFGGGRGGGPGGMGALFSALHGDFTVQDNGSYVTERLQTGEITAVSATSITAKSADGYTKTYTIDSSTEVDQGNEQVSALKTGTTVTIIAKLSGDTGTATSISDQQGRGGAPGQAPQG